MTSLLFRLFVQHQLRATAAVILGITTLFFVLTLLENLGDANIAGGIEALRATMLEMPAILHAALPPCAALGCAVSLALLEGRRELALMRILGLPRWRLLVWIACGGVLWVIAHAMVAEYLLPSSAALNRDLESQRRGTLVTETETVWLKTAGGYARFDLAGTQGTYLQQVWLFDYADEGISGVRQARSARYENDAWTLYGIQAANIGDDGWDFDERGSEAWPDGPEPDLLANFAIPPDNLKLAQLRELAASLRALEQNTVRLDLLIWSRLGDELALLGLMLAMLGLTRFRIRTDASRTRNAIIASLLAVLLFYYFQVIVKQFALDQGLPGFVGAMLPLLGIGLLLLFGRLTVARA